MRLQFWGVRGVCSVPGARTRHYGGHTTCIELVAGSADQPARLLLELGTGAINWGRATSARNVSVLLTRVLLDHLGGVPFAAPLNTAGTSITIWSQHPAATVISARVAPAFHPFGSIANFAARIDFVDLAAVQQIGPFVVRTLATSVANASALRIEADGAALVYAPVGGIQPEAAAGANILVHGATTAEGGPSHGGYATFAEAVATARATRVPRVLLMHFGPDLDDRGIGVEIEKCGLALAGEAVQVSAAREGTSEEIA